LLGSRRDLGSRGSRHSAFPRPYARPGADRRYHDPAGRRLAGRRMSARTFLRHAGGNLALLAGAFAVCALFVLGAGKDPLAALGVLLGYTLGTVNGFLEVVVRSIPFALAGLGVVVAFRANIYNVGADGQVIVGAIVAVAVMGGVDAPGWVAVPLFLGAAIVGGAAYGGVVGWLKAKY